ncbi:ribokinase [Spirabiliibacterium falconis]|uniref:ribokinase n=1 Tax=Spirabiliibacterium falconis TaxID=572023 RepID=UPI001AAD5A82|nr:ribokinase [Spirabiliibacterium falconis]MBE2893762.1 ribokinase [Spirabiliibacterium falconis]
MKKQAHICVLGSINVDHIINVPHFVKPGETLRGQHYHIAYGGKGANQAVACARLGAKTDFIACLGDDAIAHAMKKAFEKDGITTDYIQTVKNTMTGIAMIQVAHSGENSIVIASGANAALDSDFVTKCQAAIHHADALLLQLETPLSGITQAIHIAKHHNTKVILNPAPAQALPDELLAQIDIITPNETEAEILTGIHVHDPSSAQNAADYLHHKGINIVMITLGAKGVFLSIYNHHARLIKGFRVEAKDTTAAGDTFNSAFLTALLEHDNLDEAIRFAHAAAAISVTRAGAQPSIPTRQEVNTFLTKMNAPCQQ